VVSWLCERLAEGATEVCCSALDDLSSGLRQELENWCNSVKETAAQVR
jgi:hypothetical protein